MPFVALVLGAHRQDHRTLLVSREKRPRPQIAHVPERRYSVAELERKQRSAGATIEFVDERLDRPAASSKLRYSGEQREVLDPEAQRVKGNIMRCGFSWDDAAAKCGQPCPYGLVSECFEHSPQVEQNSSWSNSTYGCYADLPPCDPVRPRGQCYGQQG